MAMKEDVATMKNEMIHINLSLSKLDKSINGNGKKGLLQRIESLENWKYYLTGIFLIIITATGLLLQYWGVK